MIISLKTPEQIEIMHQANQITHMILDFVATHLDHGGNTEVLNQIAENMCVGRDYVPAFKGYRGFPKALCVSINDEIVHGIPSENRKMKHGDLVSLDFGVIYKGFYGDAARTYIVGEHTGAKYVSDEVRKFNQDTKLALYKAVEKMRVGNRLHDIGEVVDSVAKANGYGNVKAFTGHGIDTVLHAPPIVHNYINKDYPNIRLRENMVLAIEPIFVLGKEDFYISNDKWTATTKDNSLASHWELSVAITKSEPKILGI